MTRASLSLSDLPPLPLSTPSLVSASASRRESEDFSHSESLELRNIEAALESESALTAIASAGSSASVFEQSLPPVDGGRAAWLFLGSAFLVEAIVWGIPYSFGVFLDAYMKDPSIANQKGSKELLPLIGNLSSGIIYCSGPFISAFTSRYLKSKKILMWIGLVLCITSLLSASFAIKVWHLVFLEGALYGIGGSLLYCPCISYMAEWFVRRRGLANGIIFAGTAVGGLLLPLLLPPILEKYGIKATLRGCAVTMAVSILPALPLVKGRIPPSKINRPSVRSQAKVAMLNKSFLLLLGVNTIQGFAYFVPITWLPTFASSLHASTSSGGLPLAFLNGCSVLSRVGMGFLSDKYSPWLLGSITLVATSIATFLLWGVAASNLAGLISYGVLFGLMAGGWTSTWTGFIKPISDDPTTTTTLFSFLLLSRGLGNILSTPVSTSLTRDVVPSSWTNDFKTGFAVEGSKYEDLIIYVGTCFAGAAILAMSGNFSSVRSGVYVLN